MEQPDLLEGENWESDNYEAGANWMHGEFKEFLPDEEEIWNIVLKAGSNNLMAPDRENIAKAIYKRLREEG